MPVCLPDRMVEECFDGGTCAAYGEVLKPQARCVLPTRPSLRASLIASRKEAKIEDFWPYLGPKRPSNASLVAGIPSLATVKIC